MAHGEPPPHTSFHSAPSVPRLGGRGIVPKYFCLEPPLLNWINFGKKCRHLANDNNHNKWRIVLFYHWNNRRKYTNSSKIKRVHKTPRFGFPDTLWIKKNHPGFYSLMTLPDVGWFSKCIHRWTRQEICNKIIIIAQIVILNGIGRIGSRAVTYGHMKPDMNHQITLLKQFE